MLFLALIFSAAINVCRDIDCVSVSKNNIRVVFVYLEVPRNIFFVRSNRLGRLPGRK